MADKGQADAWLSMNKLSRVSPALGKPNLGTHKVRTLTSASAHPLHQV